MNWHSVRIPGKRTADAWIALTRTVHEDAGSPEDCSVHHARGPDGHHFLYFSPRCAEVFGGLLTLFGAVACERPAEIDSLAEVIGASAPIPVRHASYAIAKNPL